VTLIDTSNPIDNQTIKFKIGARASSSQPAGTYTNTINFYAVVNPAPMSMSDAFAAANKTKLNGYYKMQDMDSTICSNIELTGESSQTQLIDTRDNKVYWVAKLADGNCWMTENLELDPTQSTTAANMNASNTNATNAAISNYLNGGNPDGVNGWTSVAVSDFLDSNATKPNLVNSQKDSLYTAYGPFVINGKARAGIFYNYCAATVGTYCYASNQGYDFPGTLIDAPYDICPSNWRMPTGSESGEYANLVSQYDDSDAADPDSFQYNYSVVLSAGISPYYGPGGSGWFGWTSTYDGNGNIYVNMAESTYTDTYADDRMNGYSVRCLAW
ncbi:hypothetical protein J6X04_02660, partial [Candidatus Saccharibacteria bacterium]|nr:hypothetical protein [Candidatus Saccharibacteria bacterium]